MAPSMTRWSQDIVTFMMLRTTTRPSRTTGVGFAPPTARIPAFRRIDDGGEFLDAHHAEVADREGRSSIFVRLQLLTACLCSEFFDLCGDLGKTF